MITWGTSAMSHDASIAVFNENNQQLLFAGHSERYSRIKNDCWLNNEIIEMLYSMENQTTYIIMKYHCLKKQDKHMLNNGDYY